MAPKRSALDREVALTAAVEQTGTGARLTVRAQSRLVSAVDGLLGAAFDVPASYLEGVAMRRRAKDAVWADLTDEAGKKLTQLLGGDGPEGAVLVREMLGDRAQKLLNRRDVLARTVLELEHQSTSPENENVQTGSSESDGLDLDWLNLFGSYVDHASSERLKELWARVLAGEIRQAKSFSLSTLRVISEIDYDVASTFEKWAKLRLSGEVIPRSSTIKGTPLMELIFLEELGLISGAVSTLSRPIRTDENGIGLYIDGEFGLLIETEEKDSEVRFSFSPLTRVGKELASILDPVDQIAVFENVFSALGGLPSIRPSRLKSANIVKIVGRREGEVSYLLEKELGGGGAVK